MIVNSRPWEFIIIGGMAIDGLVVAKPVKTVIDSGKATLEAVLDKGSKRKDYYALLGLRHALLRELMTKPRNEVEACFDELANSEIFKSYPGVTANQHRAMFICDDCRLILIGGARPTIDEVEAVTVPNGRAEAA